MTNYVFISPQFPPNWRNFCVRMSEQGITVLGIGEEAYDTLHYDLKQSLAEYFKVDSLNNYDEMIRAIGYFTHRHGKIDVIESHNEHWLELDANLRKDFNVEGYKPEDLDFIKKKSRMKEIFQSNSIPVARGIIASSEDICKKFLSDVGYPVVAKPDIGVGAYATYKIHNEMELQQFFAEKPPVDYFMEEFVSGKIISYDGLVDKNGNVVFAASLEYDQNIMEIVNSDDDMYYWIHKDIDPKIEEYGKKCLQAFKTRSRFFHFEFFKLSSGNIIALEANLRPPGGYTLDMWNWTRDIDLYGEYGKVVMGETLVIEKPAQYFSVFSGRKSKFNYLHSHDDIFAKYGQHIVLHTPIPDAFAKVMGEEAYMFRVKTFEEVENITSFIAKKEESV